MFERALLWAKLMVVALALSVVIIVTVFRDLLRR